MKVKRALMAPVLLPYFLLAMVVSIKPANKGDNIYMMLNPKITRFQAIQIRAEPKPTITPSNNATNAQRFSFKDFNKGIILTTRVFSYSW